MKKNLTYFKIEGLHNTRTYEVYIEDNKLILVGENGTGKSTVAHFIYLFLTGQWNRFSEYTFKEIQATLDGRTITLPYDTITSHFFNADNDRRRPKLSISLQRQIERAIERYSQNSSISSQDITSIYKLSRTISSEIGVPPQIIRDYLQQLHIDEDFVEVDNELAGVHKNLCTPTPNIILYLPTYRRIEQDLQAIFPGTDLDDLQRVLRRRQPRALHSHHIELVEFGMDDVNRTIKREMNRLDEEFRKGLSKHTGTYLRDVLRREYVDTQELLQQLKQLDDTAIESIFELMPKDILKETELTSLRSILSEIKQNNAIESEDMIVAHFFSGLIELYKSQQEREKNVRQFVAVCNNYLIGKELVYDNREFTLEIVQNPGMASVSNLEMKMFSSGEKQIVSFFAHIYLSGNESFFVIIDEPELSLSVTWQKKLLPDIIKTERCSGLIAVTHSPFIFENDLEDYTHSIEEFMELYNVVSG